MATTEKPATTTAAPSVLPPARLAHVVLATRRFGPMVAFYKALLGARAAHETDSICFLAYDDEHHRVAIVALPPSSSSSPPPSSPSPSTSSPPRPARPGLEHVAFAYATLRDLAASYRQRRALGITPIWAVNHGPTVSMYYADPDGNRVEMQVDALATPHEADALMRSPAFAENPIGADFDPEELARRVDAGEDEAEILKRPDVGPRGLESVPWLAAGPPGAAA